MKKIGNLLYDFENCTFGGGELCVASNVSLFSLRLRDKSGNAILLKGQDSCLKELTEEKENITAQYEFALGITVYLLIQCRNKLSFRINVENHTPHKIEWVEYAPICVPRLLEKEGGTGKILWPYNEGAIITRMEDRETSFRYQEPEYPSIGSYGMYPNMVQSQFIAYLSEGKGIYLGAHDETCGPKSIDFQWLDDCIYIRIRAFTDTDFKESYRANYDTVLSTFEGDWMNAADIYSDWFTSTVGASYKKSFANDVLPQWYFDAPLIVTYPVRGKHDTDVMTPNKLYPYTEGLDVIREISEKTDSTVMALLMHWEGTAPWAPPYVWPPYGDEENFLKFAQALHADGNLLGVYCSGLGWTQKSNLTDYNREQEFEEKGYASIMCTAPDGSLPLSNICTAQRSGYDLCPACDTTKEIIRGQVKQIADANVDYIQVLDQNHGGCSYFCYSDKHGHNPGPGQWQINEMRKLLSPLSKKGMPLLGCESAAADCFLDLLRFSDNRLELIPYIGENVPLYAYLYHEYLYNFMGNQVCLLLRPSTTNYLYRVAYSFAAGDAPTLVINDEGQIVQHWGQTDFSILPDRNAALRLIRNANAWRRGFAAKYLCCGKMLRPLPISCETMHIPVCPERSDIVTPKVLSSRWRASDGSAAQILINFTEQDCAVQCPPARVFTDPKDPSVSIRSEGNLVVPALSAVLIEAEI